MKLYTYPAAPNPRRISLLLHYKGETLASEHVDIGKGEQFSAGFKAINPACTVPVLELDDGVRLTDTIAIARYLDHCFPAPPLFGDTPLEEAQVLGWCHRLFLEGFVPVAEVLRNQGEVFIDRALPGAAPVAQIPALVERGRQRIAAFWPMLDAHLQGRAFIVGRQASMADLDALVVCDFMGWVKEAIPPSCKAVQAWYQRCQPLFVPAD
ncbi:MAG TPA: glutathione S-transferase family protein [Spongiibacteraceae bacterium]|jgi:glutathione S-transferase|nr:glutathione S-transferase family protein [Spongiibacteraceae bacterium]HUH38667.1 glutathione S-transferase family protein [Spongiibacteraceae bacterium]